MNYLDLFLTFIKIGIFSFGGGYAMIPLFEKEISIHHWTSLSEYIKVIALAQMIPGPFAIDSSAYIGYMAAGFLGAIVATIALSLPAFIALLLITRFYVRFKSNLYIQFCLSGIRPAVIGLLASALYIIGFTPLKSYYQNQAFMTLLSSCLLIVLGIFLLSRTKINLILYLVIFGLAGVFLL